MDIDRVIYNLQTQLEEYEINHDPEERLDIKQTIQSKIKEIKKFYQDKKMTTELSQTISDIEEILSY